MKNLRLVDIWYRVKKHDKTKFERQSLLKIARYKLFLTYLNSPCQTTQQSLYGTFY